MQNDHDKISNSEWVDITNVCDAVGTIRTLFFDKILNMTDALEHEAGQVVGFVDFVRATAIYCLFGENEVLRFCFCVVDEDKNGFIRNKDLEALVNIMHGSENKTAATLLENAIAKHEKRRMKTNVPAGVPKIDGKIDFEEFQEMVRNDPHLMFPAFQLQQLLRCKLLGDKFWKRKQKELPSDRGLTDRNVPKDQVTITLSVRPKAGVQKPELSQPPPTTTGKWSTAEKHQQNKELVEAINAQRKLINCSPAWETPPSGCYTSDESAIVADRRAERRRQREDDAETRKSAFIAEKRKERQQKSKQAQQGGGASTSRKLGPRYS
jgi:Ca2+-binding EF-hand superfamily protein